MIARTSRRHLEGGTDRTLRQSQCALERCTALVLNLKIRRCSLSKLEKYVGTFRQPRATMRGAPKIWDTSNSMFTVHPDRNTESTIKNGLRRTDASCSAHRVGIQVLRTKILAPAGFRLNSVQAKQAPETTYFNKSRTQ
eukprot:4431212-Pleurochrysis_carterae.AAC.6